jgi:hypothetical protein
MVSEVPMFSLKIHRDDPKILKNKRMVFAITVIAAILVCVCFRLDWSAAVLMSLCAYVVKNLIYAIAGI